MLAVGRAEVASLNEAARATLRRSGHLGADVLAHDASGFAAGDKVVCLRNDRRIGVVNGTTGTVERSVGRGLAIHTSEGRRVLPNAYLDDGHLGHGYALTIHKAQGLTVERAFVLAGESLSQEAGYVAMSRARDVTELFVVRSVPDGVAHDPRRTRGVDPLDVRRRRWGAPEPSAWPPTSSRPPLRSTVDAPRVVAPRVQRPESSGKTSPTPSIVILEGVEESAMRRPWVRKS